MQVALVTQALQEGSASAGFEEQDVFDVFLEAAVFAQQVPQIAVEKAVLPNELKQGVQEKPGFFHIAHVRTGGQDRKQPGLVLLKERGHQLVLGGEVVVEVPRADRELRRDQGGRDIGLTKAIKERQGGAQNTLSSSTRGLFSHGGDKTG